MIASTRACCLELSLISYEGEGGILGIYCIEVVEKGKAALHDEVSGKVTVNRVIAVQ